MATHQLMPPAAGSTTVVFGRTYKASAGAVVSNVPEGDARVLEANGWMLVAPGGTGTTAQRPANPAKNTHYHDTTVAKNIIYDGKTWRDPDSGASV